MSEVTSKPQLIVYDFDWSFVDQDTDRYVFECLSPELRLLLRSRQTTMQWTDNVADCLQKLHAKGATREEIESAFHTLPVHPAMKRVVNTLPSRTPTTFFLLSNSNSVFISTILSHHSLTSVFSEIITNPAEWQPDGLLKVERRVKAGEEQHGCKVGCSPNMCKGKELDAFLERHGGRDAFSRILYVGDGGNDFCPILRMKSNDIACVRTHRELQRRIEREGKACGLQAQVKYWGGAWEVEQIFNSV